MGYNITVNLIPGLPKNVYDKGGYVGVVAHATANYGDTPDGERSYESRTWQNAFVHAFVGSGKIEQVADWDYICYGAGHTANHLGYAQVELCQTHDANQFAQDFDMYCWVLAWLLHRKGLPVIDGQTLMSHKQVTDKWHESTHQDPIEYLADHGRNWADVVAGIKAKYAEMSAPALASQQASGLAQPLYRVRKTADDAKTQLGAYHNLESAKTAANANPGYEVYDETGKLVYTPPVATSVAPQPAPAASQPQPEAPKPFVGTAIMGKSIATVNQMNQYIRSKNANAPLVADLYAKNEAVYGVRADVAFAQMCWETHNFLYGGRVPASANNPAGLGATDGTQSYEIFDTFEHGVDAQFQHLYGYACDKALPNVEVQDGRFKYVHRGTAPWVEWLGIEENPQHVGWASDPGYGSKLLGVLAVILKMPDVPVVVPKPVEKPVTEQPVTEQPKPIENAPQEPAKDNGGLFNLLLQFLLNFFKMLGGKQ